jgi:protein TonB
MTHAYSAGGSRRTAALTAIVGLHFGLYVIIRLGFELPDLPSRLPDPGPLKVLPLPEPDPVPAGPGDPLPQEGFASTVEQPVVSIPEFDQAEDGIEVTAADPGPAGGAGPFAASEYLPASLRTRNGRIAALIASCYPSASRRNEEEGRAIASVRLSAQAAVTSWRVHQTSGFSRLDQAMGCVLKRLEFVPARRDGQAVEAEVLLPVEFRLDRR